MALLYPAMLCALPLCIILLLIKKNSPRRIHFFSHPNAFIGLKNKKASFFLGFAISLQILILFIFLILLASPAKVINKQLNSAPKFKHALLDFKTLYALNKSDQEDFKNTILKQYIELSKPNSICLWAISDAMRPILPCSPNHYELLKHINKLTFYNRPESLSLESLYQNLKEKQLLNSNHSLSYITTQTKNNDFFPQENPNTPLTQAPLMYYINASNIYLKPTPPIQNKFLEKITLYKPTNTSDILQILPIHLTKKEDLIRAISYISPPKRTLTQHYFYSYQAPLILCLISLIFIEIGVIIYGNYQRYL